METIFVNTENNKTSEAQRFKFNLQTNLIWKILRKHGFSWFKYLLQMEKYKI